ncbi:MAG: type II CAAX endopeptidase family protein [Bacillota bacterium]|nr:type II CAAX endopeptidase family protein [Bacillota bacterium]
MKKQIDLPLTIFISVCTFIWIVFSVRVMNDYGQFGVYAQELCVRYNILDTVGFDRMCLIVGYKILSIPFLLLYLAWVLVPRLLKKSFRALYHVFTIIGVLPFMLLSIWSVPNMGDSSMFSAYVINQKVFTFSILAILGIYAYDVFKNFNNLKKPETLKKNISKCIAMCLIPIFFAIFLFGLLSMVGNSRPESVVGVVNYLGNLVPTLLGCVSSLIVIPLLEEIIFRGVIFTNLHKNGPAWCSIGLSSLFWALWHNSLSLALFYLPLGLLLAYLYSQTNLLRYPVLVHSLTNLLVGSSIVDVRGAIPIPGISYLRRIRNFVFGQGVFRSFIITFLGIGAIYFLCWLWVRESK